MQITIVQVRVPRFQKPVSIVSSLCNWGCWSRWSLVSDPFDISLHELLEKIIWQGYRSGSRCKYRAWSGKPNGRSSTTNGRHCSGGRVEQRVETKKKRENLPCLPNGLTKPLGKAFRIVKADQLVNYQWSTRGGCSACLDRQEVT